ncbi:MAG TPA: glycosyltransferase family 1 protein, partial [Saprospiraceae bacterium]|nr:glycosyltransferase family 1 protein [Saprospiraceae bacterium]
MRVGVNARLLQSDRLEGIARYLFETVQSMAKQHPEDEFILFFDRPFDTSFLNLPNIKGVLVPLATRHPILIVLWFEWLLPKALRKHQIDVFYSADNFLSLSTKTPTLLVCHDLAYMSFPQGLRWDYLWFYKVFMPKYLARADKIITVSEFVKRDVINNMQVSSNKISVAYNALPTRENVWIESEVALSTVKQLAERPYFVFVGALHPRKNIVNLIKAFIQFSQRNNKSHQLVIIGKLAWKTEEIAKMLQTEGVIHLQQIKDNQLMHILKGAVAMVYPSFFEGFGIPILEGFAAGIPVITSSVSSMPEVGGKAVLLVDPQSVNDICVAMERIANDKLLVQKMVLLGEERLKVFDWN